ncbi:hypothetical protein LCGC14_2287490, partial [marine sediment metagenome]
TNTLQGAITAATVTNTLVNNDTTDATLTVNYPPVELAGSWVTGTTHTVEPGSDRVLILVGTIAGYGDGDSTISSASYGGQPLAFIESRASSGDYDSVTEVWYLNEAGIAAASGSTFSVTWNPVPNGERYMSGFYTGVNQTTPIGAQAENFADAATPNPITTSALSNGSGDMVIVAAGGNGLGSYTAQNGFTEQQEDSWDGGAPDTLTHTVADKAATGSAETPSIQHTGMLSQQIIGFVLQAFVPTNTIGDGTSPAIKDVAPDSTNNAVNAFTLVTDTGADTVTALTVTFTGTAVADVAASGVKIYDDSTGGTANEWDAGDTLKGTASFSGTTASVTVSISVDSSATQYLVTYDIATGATASNTLQGAITNATATYAVVNNDTTDATLTVVAGVVTAALTGSLADNAVENELRYSGQTLIITLTNDTWLPAGAGGGFPQVQSVTETPFLSNTTTHNVSMPATVNSGDLLIAHLTFDASASVNSTPTDWTPVDANRLNLYMKVADGTEGGTTVDFPTTAIEAGAAQVHRQVVMLVGPGGARRRERQPAPAASQRFGGVGGHGNYLVKTLPCHA